jgi:hypothetical protein
MIGRATCRAREGESCTTSCGASDRGPESPTLASLPPSSLVDPAEPPEPVDPPEPPEPPEPVPLPAAPAAPLVVVWLPAAPATVLEVEAPAAPVDDALELAPPLPAGLPDDSSAGPHAQSIKTDKPNEALRMAPSIGTP